MRQSQLKQLIAIPRADDGVRWLNLVMLMALAAGLTFLSGLVQGRLANRWGTPAELATAAERLEAIPDQIGKWRLDRSEQLSDEAVSMLQCQGYINRTYVHADSGAVVQATLLLGPTGPMSVHTPELCYSSRDFRIDQPRQRIAIGGATPQPAALWRLTLRSNDVEAKRLRVLYGWSDGQAWYAPQWPRFALSSRPYLYKLQVATYLAPHLNGPLTDPCEEFVEQFLPVTEQCLVH